ncbi:HAD hydrolase-like protein [Taibaiella lutea]|uniref:HAD hydrolase-like protein n=1 Tax=Taibaiella lutea TaxID=2608001 RepID=A0A5M6CN87_9BACT|nr:HAD family hydrolase [Taibaiella lutea]KAA5534609.1 HAD hydrolase-like protein [Taibaiella lutea]
MAIKLIVFDMAGTTVEDNQNVAQALKKALSVFHYQVTFEDINIVMGYPKPIAIRSLLEQYAGSEIASDNDLVTRIHDVFVKEIIHFYEMNESIREKEGAGYVFRKLREMNIRVALDTGFSREIADAIINRLGWIQGEHFDISITSDEVMEGRPYPYMIYKAMEKLQIASIEEVAKVGDTVSDLQEGNAAGCKYVIGITTGAYTEAELLRERHTHLINKLEDILDIVAEEEVVLQLK